MPPGHPEWHLPPANAPMVFQGLSPAQLASTLKDPAKNGGKTLPEILRNVTEYSLVLSGWNPGKSRTKPPLTHEEFVANMRTWIEGGGVEPD